MRELTLTIGYQTGVDPVMDTFIEYPDLVSSSVDSCASRDRFWRIERFDGPTAALDRIERVRLDDAGKEEMTRTNCGATRSHDLIERSQNSRVIYTYVEHLHRCDSVVGLAARHLDPGMVFQSRRHGRYHTWRLLIRSKENVGVFYDAVKDHLRDELTLHLDRLCEVESWSIDSLATVSMADEQREALRTAVEHGYYETPRQVTIDELADEMDVPTSTVSYRLRRAEAQLARGFVSDRSRESPPEYVASELRE